MDTAEQMKSALVAQNLKIQQLTSAVEELQAERERERETVAALRMAVFESSTRARHVIEQCKRDAIAVAVEEISRDREAIAEGHEEVRRQLAEVEGALNIALGAATGVHEHVLSLGMSCEDLGKSSIHLSAIAQEVTAPQDSRALSAARIVIEAMVGVMRAMEFSGVFNLLERAPTEEQKQLDAPSRNQSLPPPHAQLVPPDDTPAPVSGEAVDGESVRQNGREEHGSEIEVPQEVRNGHTERPVERLMKEQEHGSDCGQEQGREEDQGYCEGGGQQCVQTLVTFTESLQLGEVDVVGESEASGVGQEGQGPWGLQVGLGEEEGRGRTREGSGQGEVETREREEDGEG